MAKVKKRLKQEHAKRVARFKAKLIDHKRATMHELAELDKSLDDKLFLARGYNYMEFMKKTVNKQIMDLLKMRDK